MLSKKSGGIPEYGTIQQRKEVGIMEYVDPKGRKPVAYTKIMKKLKVSQEDVIAEARKFNMEVNEVHFVEAIVDGKRGRPKTSKELKETKGAKGRPKKEPKVVELNDEQDDLFAAMVADVQTELVSVSELADEEQQEEVKPNKKNEKSEEERAAKKAAEDEAKAAKKAASSPLPPPSYDDIPDEPQYFNNIFI
jgi:hypothetical protein